MLTTILMVVGLVLMFCMGTMVILAISFTVKETILRWYKGISMVYTKEEMIKWNR